ncbi:hypothetical protein CARUB_v10023874mg [Capsella rubella]|uniref:Chitin-binding type-1 domain-containing protein n=1 Tax=Capsella rubella TaxID=81985 RepID=R0FY85_9BRAS|nr:endochitinase At2g43590 [Capsella rubella]EOA27721.1 hypothetical protein CARUB_v10023874mg [Capsella rubella]
MALTKVSSIFLICLFGFYSQTAAQAYCGCSPILCCSQNGYCGINDLYCGSGCRSGPCRRSRVPVDRIVTQQFFNDIISKASNDCAGKRFYTRESFLKAANDTFDFTSSVNSLEIATMFAHFTYVTGNFCQIDAVNGTSGDYCEESNKQYPCAQGKSYHGRGPIQLSGNSNYGTCGQGIGLDLLRQPELVGSNSTVAFKTGLWFWMTYVRPVLNQGFGATIRAVNGLDCNGENSGAIDARIEQYIDYCKQLGVDPGQNLRC